MPPESSSPPDAGPPAQRESPPAPPDAYQRLAETAGPRKAAVLFDVIEEHQDGRLVMPKANGEGAQLSGVNLSVEALGSRFSPARAAAAPWWNDEENGFCLRGADLRGAVLRGAVLRGVDLRGANLRGATLGGTDLRGAQLENADLREADLVSANLADAQLGGANLSRALLENADLQNAYFRFARLQYAAFDDADLRNADLWGADLEGASMRGANLHGALLHEANVQDADLTGSDLRETDLRDAVLREANLSESDLREADLDGADLQRALLRGARMQGLLLTGCTLDHVHLGEAQLGQARLRQRQLGGAIGEELDAEYEAASYGYLSLEQAFADLGDPDAVRWAYIRKRTMQKLAARQYAAGALRRNEWREALRNGLSYVQAKLVEVICGYGESIPRTLGSIFLVYAVFVVLYGLTGSVVRASGDVVALWPPGELADIATFGLITMTAPEGPQVGLHPNGDLAHLLTSLQTLITIGLTGLLGYVLGNRIHK